MEAIFRMSLLNIHTPTSLSLQVFPDFISYVKIKANK